MCSARLLDEQEQQPNFSQHPARKSVGKACAPREIRECNEDNRQRYVRKRTWPAPMLIWKGPAESNLPWPCCLCLAGGSGFVEGPEILNPKPCSFAGSVSLKVFL